MQQRLLCAVPSAASSASAIVAAAAASRRGTDGTGIADAEDQVDEAAYDEEAAPQAAPSTPVDVHASICAECWIYEIQVSSIFVFKVEYIIAWIL